MGISGKEVVLISEDLEGFKGSSGPLPAHPDIQEIFLSEEDEFLILAWNNYDTCSLHLFAHARKELMDNNDSERCARELVRKALRWRWGTNMKDVVATDLGWMFLITALCLETLSIYCDQVSSPQAKVCNIRYGVDFSSSTRQHVRDDLQVQKEKSGILEVVVLLSTPPSQAFQ
ncbi:hypothetical protein DVH24_010146 [Malus domestica]|uniref:Uncharacterized protein n=1 Tax=Malus domestica TaxID=3750 RepID=A0A498JX95_MALDO|nr:hypothetical protein DVH24_010146 [Malus domestica]